MARSEAQKKADKNYKTKQKKSGLVELRGVKLLLSDKEFMNANPDLKVITASFIKSLVEQHKKEDDKNEKT